jgi:hypothetical protein
MGCEGASLVYIMNDASNDVDTTDKGVRIPQPDDSTRLILPSAFILILLLIHPSSFILPSFNVGVL